MGHPSRRASDIGVVHFVSEAPTHYPKNGAIYRRAGNRIDVMSRATFRAAVAEANLLIEQMDLEEGRPLLSLKQRGA